MLDEIDKKIIRAMQEDFPLVLEPYAYLAEQIGITEEELIRRLKAYRQTGKVRKMGAVLRHRNVGFAANALGAWMVPENRLDEVGKIMIASPAVTHCYSRITKPDWPYNFYTMIHGESRDHCQEIATKLAQAANVFEYTLLFSTKEWKKTSMRYFQEDIEA